MKIEKILFDDKIVLYWNRDELRGETDRYFIRVNGAVNYTQKTHFTINGLLPCEEMEIAVGIVDARGETIKEYGVERICLLKQKKNIDVTKSPYFAVGDGKTLNTEALQRALNDCKIDERVYIPNGIFLTGALDVKGDTEIYVEKGGVLQGTETPNDYLPKIKSRFEGIEGMCYRSLLNIGKLDNAGGYTSKNIVLRGAGAILGGGFALMKNTIEQEGGSIEAWEKTEDDVRAWRSRGRLLNISNAQNVVIHGLELGMGAAWNIHMIYSDSIVTSSCYIRSEGVNNGDGWDPDSSTNCTIFDCDFKTRDDMIAIKSGKNPEGNKINRPSKNIRIFDCRCTMGHGLAMGSEMSGGIDGVYIWDCDIEKSRCGLEIKATKKRGGYVKNVYVNDCKCSILAIRSVGYNDDGEGAKEPPVFENYRFEDISLTGIIQLHTGEKRVSSAVIVKGFEDGYPVKNVSFKKLTIKKCEESPQMIEINAVKGVSFENIVCE